MHRAVPKSLHPDRRLIDVLKDPRAFDHGTNGIEEVETHISWLLLAGDFVYKIKKPLVLDFLDFGSLEKRRFFCDEEIRLNKPWAPDIYIDVVPITTDGIRYRFGGSGEIVEYAVRMHRFDQRLRLDRQLQLGALTVPDMRELAANIARQHAQAPATPTSERERIVLQTETFIRDNFVALQGTAETAVLNDLRRWSLEELERFGDLLYRRFDDGFFRDCHGDLHLGNLVRLAGGITTFDCIEFNSDLRNIDVICDIGFLVMDLVARDAPDLAAHFLNRYLECTGDYAGVALLDTYFVYRCLVRAKIAAIRSQERDTDDEVQQDRQEVAHYVGLAQQQTAKESPVLLVMTGLSGSGKTRIAGELMAALPAIRLRSDIERKRMHDLGETEHSGSAIGAGIYSPLASRDVYERMIAMAVDLLRSGHNAILDATFLEESERRRALSAADACDCAALIVHVLAPVETLRKRIRERSADDADASEATLAVLEHQIDTQEPLTEAEKRLTCQVENTGDVNVAGIVNEIRQLAGATRSRK